jgi:hypothetical protein
MSVRGIHTWTGTSTARWAWVVVACVVVVSLIAAIMTSLAFLLLLVLAVPAFGMTKIMATVDLDGLSVRSAWFRWPTRRITLEDIVAVRSIDLKPWTWGGWGYRWRPKKGVAIVTRRGSAISVERKSGRVFDVTIDDAPAGAAVLRSHVDHLPPS